MKPIPDGILASIGFFLSVICLVIVFISKTRNNKDFLGRGKLLWVTVCLLMSICFWRMAITPVGTLSSGEVYIPAKAKGVDKFLLCLLDSARTFNLDANYAHFVKFGRNYIEGVKWLGSAARSFFYYYFAVLYMAAPVTGALVILEILASLFSRFKLWLLGWNIKKEIVYFSELNEQSLALAKSIVTKHKGCRFTRPLLVFTDVYTDRDEEKSTELTLGAKGLGAVCLSKDILHIRMRSFFKKKIFLIDYNEGNNIQVLSVLSGASRRRILDGAEVYVFSNESDYSLITHDIRRELENLDKTPKPTKKSAKPPKTETSEQSKNGETCEIKEENSSVAADAKADEKSDTPKAPPVDKHTQAKEIADFDCWLVAKPWIQNVNSNKNLTKNLLKEVPLYEPLIGRKKGDKPYDYNLTIFGAGEIGTEMFLAAYWCGQMLGCRLHINVVSRGTEEEFINKIDYINSELPDTIVRIKPLDGSSPTLDKRFNNDKGFAASQYGKSDSYGSVMQICSKTYEVAEPYCTFRYLCADVENGEIDQKLTKPLWEDGFKLCDSDYFVVTLGSDKANLSVADNVKRFVAITKLDGVVFKEKNTVISYVVYDSELCRRLNSLQDNQIVKNHGIYMHAFGSFEDVFDTKNVYMKQEELISDDGGKGFDKYEQYDVIKDYHTVADTQYDFWANVSRTFHIRYKVFSADFIKESAFTTGGRKKSKDFANEFLENYIAGIVPTTKEEKETKEAAEKYMALSWLEHRRWCAFMRVTGFRHAKDYTRYQPYTNSHKEMTLKLHPCLVETRMAPIDKNLNETGINPSRHDCLDELTYHYNCHRKKGEKPKEFKKHDGPTYSFACNDDGVLMSEAEMKKKLQSTLETKSIFRAAFWSNLGRLMLARTYKVFNINHCNNPKSE